MALRGSQTASLGCVLQRARRIAPARDGEGIGLRALVLAAAASDPAAFAAAVRRAGLHGRGVGLALSEWWPPAPARPGRVAPPVSAEARAALAASRSLDDLLDRLLRPTDQDGDRTAAVLVSCGLL